MHMYDDTNRHEVSREGTRSSLVYDALTPPPCDAPPNQRLTSVQNFTSRLLAGELGNIAFSPSLTAPAASRNESWRTFRHWTAIFLSGDNKTAQLSSTGSSSCVRRRGIGCRMPSGDAQLLIKLPNPTTRRCWLKSSVNQKEINVIHVHKSAKSNEAEILSVCHIFNFIAIFCFTPQLSAYELSLS